MRQKRPPPPGGGRFRVKAPSDPGVAASLRDADRRPPLDSGRSPVRRRLFAARASCRVGASAGRSTRCHDATAKAPAHGSTAASNGATPIPARQREYMQDDHRQRGDRPQQLEVVGFETDLIRKRPRHAAVMVERACDCVENRGAVLQHPSCGTVVACARLSSHARCFLLMRSSGSARRWQSSSNALSSQHSQHSQRSRPTRYRLNFRNIRPVCHGYGIILLCRPTGALSGDHHLRRERTSGCSARRRRSYGARS